MGRGRSLFGKRPGGNFSGIPGNLGPKRGWGSAFGKKGDWGILNPSEWVGFGKRQGLVESVLRPQYSLQDVISKNLNPVTEQQTTRARMARERTAPPTVIVPTPLGQIQRRTPSPDAGAGKAAPVGAKTTPKGVSAPKATPKTATAKAVAAKTPAPVAAIRKAPLKRGR